MTSGGVVTLDNLDANSSSARERARAQAFNDILAQSGNHLFSDQYSTAQLRARDIGEQVNAALAGQSGLSTDFAQGNPLAQSLRMVAEMIQARSALDTSRQIFFVALGGWDTHGEQLIRHPAQLSLLSEALTSFNDVTEELGVQNSVTTFTAADFGRTLTSNGDGSDHGWGGNQLIMGGAVNGSNMYGLYPDLIIGGPDDYGNGRIIPTTSVDQFGATLARWYGNFSESQLREFFPNLGNFSSSDMGFLGS